MAELSSAPGTSATASAGRAVPDIRLVGLVKRFGEFAAVDGVDLDVARGRVLHAAGTVGLGQDDDAAHHRRVRAARRGARRARRPRRRSAAALRARRQHGLPGLRALPAHDRRRQRRVRPAHPQGPARPSAAPRTQEALRDGAPGRATAGASPRSSPAASASASRWPARSSTARACCCSTSRSARSTSSCARRCRSSSSASRTRSGITFVFVTHDQEEALTMSDRLAVFNDGRDRAGRHAGRGLRAARATSSWPASSAPRTCSERGRAERIHDPARRRSACSSEADAPRQALARRGRAPCARSPTSAWSRATWSRSTPAARSQVVRQNLETSSAEALEATGRRVMARLARGPVATPSRRPHHEERGRVMQIEGSMDAVLIACVALLVRRRLRR